MTESWVELVERDLKEVAEAEIKRFLEHYEECEVVDAIYTHWDFKTVVFDVLIHGLPCDISKYIAIEDKNVKETDVFDCNVIYENEDEEILMGWVRIVMLGNKCYADKNVMEGNVHDVAEKIVREAEAGE
jgi:hypothetical protein